MAKKNNGGEKKGKGKVLINKDGVVTRTYPQPSIGTGYSSTYEQIDTTGYSRGKKGFAKEKGSLTIGGNPLGPTVTKRKHGYESVSRKDVLKEMENMKKGASGTEDWRDKKPGQKKSSFSKTKDIRVIKAIKAAALKVQEQKKKKKEKSEDGRPRKLKQLKGKQQF